MFSRNKKFCKVCYDAGRPEHEYTSHYVKDQKGPHGKVVCPLLLNVECNYCHQRGHTPSHCPVLKQRDAYRAQERREMMNPPVYDFHDRCCQPNRTQRKRLDLSGGAKKVHKNVVKEKKAFDFSNIFQILDEELGSGSGSKKNVKQEEKKVEEDFPSLPSSGGGYTKPIVSSWGKKMSPQEMTNHLRSLILKDRSPSSNRTELYCSDTSNSSVMDNSVMDERYCDDYCEESDSQETIPVESVSDDDIVSESSVESFVYKKSWADIMDEEDEMEREMGNGMENELVACM